MFVQINDAYAALRRRLTRRPSETGPRYVRKSKVTERRIYGRPLRHRADSRRPSYSHPAQRARRAFVAALRQSPRRPIVRRPRPSNALARRDAAPVRSTRAIGRAAVVRYRTVNASVLSWLRDPGHAARSHRDPSGPHRREHLYLPNIGWCWDTSENPKVSA